MRATSGTGARVKTADQPITVTVTDEAGEAPGVPATPTVTSASVTSVTVTWAAPSNEGPAITDYDYRYRVKTPEGSWVEVTDTTSTAVSATIPGLAEDTEYEVQVRATNAEGDSGWSEAGSGSTDANAAPEFTSSATFTAAENQTTVGTVTATDDDSGDGVTGYTIQGGAGPGDVRDRRRDRGADVHGGAELRGPDGRRRQQRLRGGGAGDQRHGRAGEDGGPADHGDGDGRGRRGAGRADHGDGDVGLGDECDGDLGRALERGAADHGLRLPVPGEDAGGVLGGGDGHDEHGGERDDPGACGGHRVRGAGAGDQRRRRQRLVGGGQRLDGRERGPGVHLVGDVHRGGEPDRGGDGHGDGRATAATGVTGYTIAGGADQATFSIVAATGVLTFTAAPNFEAPTDGGGNNDYEVVVRATSGTGARVKTADQPITVTVTDVAGEAPGVPATPTVTSASVTSVTVTWAAPSNEGPAITDYDYRYRVKTPEGSWVEVTDTTSTAVSATIPGLAEDTEYEVQVRATNADGDSGWSEAGSGSTDANAAPAFTSSATFTAAENQTAVGTVTATDERQRRPRDGLHDRGRRGPGRRSRSSPRPGC